MSRLPPQIKQKVNGQKVDGYSVIPIEHDGVMYKLESAHRYSDAGDILGIDWFVCAHDSGGAQIWKTEYFNNDFELELGLETDVQESYPIDFHIKDNELFIEHEYRDLFHLKLDGALLERIPRNNPAGIHAAPLPPSAHL